MNTGTTLLDVITCLPAQHGGEHPCVIGMGYRPSYIEHRWKVPGLASATAIDCQVLMCGLEVSFNLLISQKCKSRSRNELHRYIVLAKSFPSMYCTDVSDE